MRVYIVVYNNHTISLFSQAPLPSRREFLSHCFCCSDLLSIEILRNFLASAFSYIDAGNIQFVTIEGFTLVY